MQTVRNIIKSNKTYFDQFEYYYLVIDKIEKNVSYAPDICIESCKSLIEGTCKTILTVIDVTFDVKEAEKKGIKVQVLFKSAVNKLSERSDDIETEFASRIGPLIKLMGEMRNKRGDISHGKAVPKEVESKASFSRFVLQITEGIVLYLLRVFFSIDFSYRKVIDYEENVLFNQMLDEMEPLEGLSYSRALFDQDETAYTEQLAEFNAEEESQEL